jgi:Protein of unknown function (DUF2946)
MPVRLRLLRREGLAARLAAWLAIFGIAWQALQPFASLAAADTDSGHACPTTGLHSLELPGADPTSDESKGDRLHCGFCVGVQAPTMAWALESLLGEISHRSVVVGIHAADAPEIRQLTAPPLPPRGPPHLS